MWSCFLVRVIIQVNHFEVPPKPRKTLFSVDEVLEVVLDDDGDELSEI